MAETKCSAHSHEKVFARVENSLMLAGLRDARDKFHLLRKSIRERNHASFATERGYLGNYYFFLTSDGSVFTDGGSKQDC